MSLSAVNAQQTDNRQLLRDSINAYKVQGSAMNLQKILDGMQKKGGLNGIQEDRTLYGIQKMLARQSGIDALLPADVKPEVRKLSKKLKQRAARLLIINWISCRRIPSRH